MVLNHFYTLVVLVESMPELNLSLLSTSLLTRQLLAISFLHSEFALACDIEL